MVAVMAWRQAAASPWRRRAARTVAALLLAGVSLALTGGRSTLTSADRTPASGLDAALEEALAASRPLRLRLSVAAPYRPCGPADRSVSVSSLTCDPLLPAEARRALARATPAAARRKGDRRSRHDVALADLVTASTSRTALQRAVRELSGAASRSPDDPALLTDLAVAHALLGASEGDPRDLLRALAATDRALALAPDAAAPAFDRALLLEQLGLDDSARLAWRRYLARHDEPGFADEARDADRRLRQRIAASTAPDDLDQIARQAADGSDGAALALAAAGSPALDLQRARELAFDHLLGAWGEARGAGDPAAADRILATVRRLGSAIHNAHGDCTVSASVARIDAAAGDPRELGRLAEAHAAYARGAALWRRLRPEEAEPNFARTLRLTASDHPLHLWSRMGLAGVLFYRHDHEAAADAFADLLQDTEGTCLDALAGRAAWGLGLTRIRQGRYAEAVRIYSAAEQRFARLGERESRGALQTLLGETYTFLGQPETAWVWWRRALGSLGRYRGSLRLHNLLWEMARAAADDVGPAAGVAIANEGVLNARRSSDPALLPEALLWRARLHAGAGEPDVALADLEEAAARNDRRSPGPARDVVAADLQVARGIVLGRRGTAAGDAAAIDALSGGLRYYQAHDLALPQPEALLARARLDRRRGLPHQADGDLDAALALYRDQRTAIEDVPLGRDFTETMQAIFEAALDLRIGELGASPEEALELAEEARDVGSPWRTRAAADPLPLAAIAAAAPDATVLLYMTTASHLHVWRLRDGTVELVSRRVDRATLESRIRALVDAVRGGADLDALAPEATALHRLLLPPPLAQLAPETPLYVVPDRSLASLPFDLLRDPATGLLLIERHPIALAPSLRALANSFAADHRVAGGPLTATVIADPAFDAALFPALPRLPGTASEARRIAALYPDAEVLAGAAATPEAVLAALDRHPVLHYAGHAIFNPRQPLLSVLPLAAPSGAADATGTSTLYARDLEGLHFHTLRLVVLSACTTLGPTDRRTTAISGLARPFLDAGATAVVGTLWPVTDEDAARILPEFHRRLIAGGDATQALRGAKLALLRNPRQTRPADWTAYQMVGPFVNH